MDELMLMNV